MVRIKVGQKRISRAGFFGWLLSALEKHPWPIIDRIQLEILLLATCRGFDRMVTEQEMRKAEEQIVRESHRRSLNPARKPHRLSREPARGIHRLSRQAGWKILVGREPLRSYALFTYEALQLVAGNASGLYQEALTLGSRIRRITGLTDSDQLRRLVFLLYRNIGITMTGEIPGEIVVERCFFSDIYSPAECAAMSAMDNGIVSGIFGGGRLEFRERITEGCGKCRACFEVHESI